MATRPGPLWLLGLALCALGGSPGPRPPHGCPQRRLGARERRDMQREILAVLGLPGRPRPRVPPAAARQPASAPLFMLDLYHSMAGDDDEDGGPSERHLGRADLVMSFVNMVERDRALGHQEPHWKEFHFDLTQIPAGEAVTAAEFRVYKLPSTRLLNTTLRISMFQVVQEHSNRESDLFFLDLQTLRAGDEGWLVLDVTAASDRWLLNRNKDLGLRLYVETEDGGEQQRGRGRLGLGLLLATKQVRRVDRSYLGENTLCEQQYLEGELDLEPTPRGTLAERIQPAAPGARLLGAHPLRLAGAGRRRTHQVLPRRQPGHPELPRKVREFQGQLSLLEHAIRADFPLVKGWKADRAGNVILKNSNVPTCKAADVTVVQVEKIVDVRTLLPGDIHVPNIYVDRVIKGPKYRKESERLGLRSEEDGKALLGADTRTRIMQRKFEDRMCANVGIRISLLASNFISPDMTVHLHSENGILGLGPFPSKDEMDPDVIKAGRQADSHRVPQGAVSSSGMTPLL
ncbi:Bone morphogenetic protein 8A [Sciurus carolinensis]|uniref:Bone morphogenetic protein 8A n=1 Tax=Sciurus carolinensis TaxID=30640 RepID=A0AA41SVU6_SCICA|nr:Bone morphogenetic protein 8A [Sciurus carolinensis]